MPLEDFEFKRDGNTLRVFDKATGELIDSGEYVEVTSHKQKRRFVAFEKYSYKKFELEEKLWVGADFLKRNLMSSVRYFNAPVLGCRTYFNKEDVDRWVADNFLPYRRTIALCLSDLTPEEQEWVKGFANRYNERANQLNLKRNPNEKKQFIKDMRKEWVDYIGHEQANRRMAMFQSVETPDRTAIYPPVQIQDGQYRFRLDHVGDVKPLPKGNMSEITMKRRAYMINCSTIEWKFGKGLRPKTLFEVEKLPDDAMWRLFSRKVRSIVSQIYSTTSYELYLKNGGKRR